MGPDQWLSFLTARMDNRAGGLRSLRDRLEGNGPLPEASAEAHSDGYEALQRQARGGLAESITDAVANRMKLGSFRVAGVDNEDPRVRDVWNRSRANTWCGDVHRDMIGLGSGYVMAQPGPAGAVLLQIRPEQGIVEPDPLVPGARKAALVVVRDFVAERDYAYLHLRGVAWRYVRPMFAGTTEAERKRPTSTMGGGWALDKTYSDEAGRATGLDRIPIVDFINRGGVGEFETHTDAIDRVATLTFQGLVIAAVQAFRQRAIKGDLPEKDEAGNPINYPDLLKPGAGAMWTLPPDVEIWESGQADLQGILSMKKDALLEVSASTKTPMTSLMPDSVNQSAEGALTAKEDLFFKVGDRVERARSPWAEALSIAVELDTRERVTVEVDFLAPDRITMAERYDAMSKAGNDVPWRTKMTDILGFDGPKVDQMAAQRAEDAVFAASFAAPPTVPGATQTAPSAEGTSDGGAAGSTGNDQPGDSGGRVGSSAG